MSDKTGYRTPLVTRAIRAARAGGLDNFDVVIGPGGLPIIRVRSNSDTTDHLIDELEAWDREQGHAA